MRLSRTAVSTSLRISAISEADRSDRFRTCSRHDRGRAAAGCSAAAIRRHRASHPHFTQRTSSISGISSSHASRPCTENSDGALQRELLLIEPRDRHGRQHAARGTAVNADIIGAVGLQQLLVNGFHVFAGGWKLVVRPFTVIHGNHFYLSRPGDRNGLQFGATRPATRESAAVKIDEHAIPVIGINPLFWRVDIDMDAPDFGIFAVYRIKNRVAGPDTFSYIWEARQLELGPPDPA